ncbi:MAG TPA: hypothetical protein VHA12_03565 [Candidatus Nanoarchaeia archaeon]|nr:hypothetical protein [Candidatus Nanoarchaeia archaeon]
MKSNTDNVLLLLAIAAVLVSAVGAGVTYSNLGMQKETLFTGFATTTDNATVNITILSSIAINFTTDSINFGAGRLDIGATNATLVTIPTINNSGGNWTNVTSGFILENIGNLNVSIYLMTGKTAATFLGGTNPQYQYNVTPVADNGNALASPQTSCMNLTAGFLSVWHDVNNTQLGSNRDQEGTYVCSNFSYQDTNTDTLRIDLRLVVPSDSFTGALGDIMTASAYQSV